MLLGCGRAFRAAATFGQDLPAWQNVSQQPYRGESVGRGGVICMARPQRLSPALSKPEIIPMTAANHAALTTRDTIMNILSDAETTKVTIAEGSALPEGEEYVDLEQLDKGVLLAGATMSKETMGHILPRSAVHGDTWTKILAQLNHF
jgi:hypothetical protein